MKKLLIAIIITSSTAHAADCNLPATKIIFHKDLEGTERKLIEDDLKWLQELKLQSNYVQNASKVLNAPIQSGQDLHHWLLTRVRRLTYSLSELQYEMNTIKEKVSYPFADLKPALETPWGSKIDLPTEGPDRIRNYASNISASEYENGKLMQELFRLDNVPGLGKVTINSPRTGIININFSFFDPNFFGHEVPTDSLAQRIFRLSVLFHEARHSDGQGVSLSFPHSVCPKGHRFAGLASCDDTENGGYAVGISVLRLLQDSSPQLNKTEADFLKSHLEDWNQRLHAPKGDSKLRNLNVEPEILNNHC